MCSEVFTIASVDNIDHNPSSTTSMVSFHGTGISLFQQPAFPVQGVDHSIVIFGSFASQKIVDNLPSYYTDIPPFHHSTTKAPVPPDMPTKSQQLLYVSCRIGPTITVTSKQKTGDKPLGFDGWYSKRGENCPQF